MSCKCAEICYNRAEMCCNCAGVEMHCNNAVNVLRLYCKCVFPSFEVQVVCLYLHVWSISCLSNFFSMSCPFLVMVLSPSSLCFVPGSFEVHVWTNPVLSMYGSYGPCFFPFFKCLIQLGRSEIQT